MIRGLTIALLCGLAACEPAVVAPPPVAPAAPVAPPAEPPPTFTGAAAPQPAIQWTGEWRTSWGPMQLVQQGATVTGDYTYQNQGVEVLGHLSGTVSGLQLDFDWDEPPGGGGQGRGTFVMSADGHAFEGTWGKGKSRNDGGVWTGTR